MGLARLAVGPLQENSYIVWDDATREAFVVDPGGDVMHLIGMIKERELTVRAIVNTHGHVDHIAGVRGLQDILEVPFRMHAGDRFLLGHAEGYAGHIGLAFTGLPEPMGEPLTDNEELALGASVIRVIHTPGHTPGGVCLLFGEDLLTGDTLFLNSIGRTDFPGGDGPTLLISIRDRLLTLPDATRVHPGHGAPTSIGAERRRNPYLQNL